MALQHMVLAAVLVRPYPAYLERVSQDHSLWMTSYVMLLGVAGCGRSEKTWQWQPPPASNLQAFMLRRHQTLTVTCLESQSPADCIVMTTPRDDFGSCPGMHVDPLFCLLVMQWQSLPQVSHSWLLSFPFVSTILSTPLQACSRRFDNWKKKSHLLDPQSNADKGEELAKMRQRRLCDSRQTWQKPSGPFKGAEGSASCDLNGMVAMED